MKSFKLLILIGLLLPVNLYSQTPDNPFFPETAAGARDLSWNMFPLKWLNPTNVSYNKIYLSYDSTLVANLDPSVEVVDGFPGTVYDSYSVEDLLKTTRYYWRVVEYNEKGFTSGPVWNFVTTSDPYTELYHYDDFRNGIGNWTIYNNLSCDWELGDATDYTLPVPSTGKILVADNSNCGSTINSTAEYPQINLLFTTQLVWVEFDSDWKSVSPSNAAIVEMSTDQGNTWEEVWNKTGVSVRDSHLVITLLDDFNQVETIRVRLRTIQNGGDSWWAIDNFKIGMWSGVLTPWFISNLHTYVNEDADEVLLGWTQNLGIPGVFIYRKNGIPDDPGEYEIVGVITDGSRWFTDSSVVDSTIYTYKVGNGRMTNEATAYVFSVIPVELISFTADVADNNVMLNWQTATETNNRGFKIQRKSDNPSFTKGGKQEGFKGEDFEVIGFAEGNGTTTETKSYSFIDNNVSAGKYHYRLKQIDFDGSYEYSEIIEIEVGTPNEFYLSQNYPNPFNPETTIKYSIPNVISTKGRNLKVSIKVYDILGKQITTLVNEQNSPGEYEVKFSGKDLPSGIYFIKLNAGSYSKIIKAILMK